MWVRVPVVVGVNATMEEMRAIAKIVNDSGAEKVELLPYHAFGESKYQALDMQPQTFKRPTDEQLQTFLQAFTCQASVR